ncbi:hypothetical protein PHMEG_00037043, partial [Phytophthora megakarya]
NQDWVVWKEQVEIACSRVFSSQQSLENALVKTLGQATVRAAVASAPALNQWARAVAGTAPPATQAGVQQKDFLFKQAKYSAEEIMEMRRVCEQSFGKHRVAPFREATKIEWKVLEGLVDGTIVCRKLPQFLTRIMSNENRLQLTMTIRAQVEGCLVMDLKGEWPVKEAFQSTRSLQESISTAAMARRMGSEPLWQMLAAVKTISYSAIQHAIMFHFFTRDIAKTYEGLTVPFHRGTHTLVNIHSGEEAGETGDAWSRQFDQNGELIPQTVNYVVTLKNVTRTMDQPKLLAFLKFVLKENFTWVDLDQGGSHSSTSTSWELTFTSEGCPAAFDGVVRIIWCNSNAYVAENWDTQCADVIFQHQRYEELVAWSPPKIF